jgi:hypothetical protein
MKKKTISGILFIARDYHFVFVPRLSRRKGNFFVNFFHSRLFCLFVFYNQIAYIERLSPTHSPSPPKVNRVEAII